MRRQEPEKAPVQAPETTPEEVTKVRFLRRWNCVFFFAVGFSYSLDPCNPYICLDLVDFYGTCR